jgi:glycosyltransferase involved in cell wall biosynthesis
VTGRLRIASLTTFYPPYNFGGDGIDVQRTARALARRGHEVTVIHSRDAFRTFTDRPVTPVDDPDVEVIGLESRFPKLASLLTHQLGRPVVHARTLAALDRARRFDVVLLNNVSLVGGPGLLRFGQDAIRLYIAHEHWLVCPTHVLWRYTSEPCNTRDCLRCVLRQRRPPQLWRYTGSLERALRHVHAFLARSEFSRAKHEAYGFPREMDVLPNFVPLSDPPGDGPSPHPRPFFLFAGRLEALKGVDDVILAHPHDAASDLLIAGDGNHGPALRALAAGHPRVHFLGTLSHARLAAYYQHALATIVPSLCYETFGLVVAEAFSHGTPVIARRLGPLPELVDAARAGELFGTRDELVEAMRRIEADPQRARRLGEAGRRAVLQYWSEEPVIGRLLEIIERERARRDAPVTTTRATTRVGG